MNITRTPATAFCIALFITSHISADFPPVTPNASDEVKTVLKYHYDITGKGILVGVCDTKCE
jgi:hypothetical protein